MSDNPMVDAGINDFLKKSLREQLTILMKAWTKGSAPADAPWLSQGVAQALMMRILVESSHRLEGLTTRLVWLTVILAILTAVLAYDVFPKLFPNVH
jgi:hypothetical protein